jgi:hypothetical protein
MTAATWTDDFLDEMREVGDAPADAVVAAIFAGGEVDAVNKLMKTLVRNDGVPAKQLPPEVRDYLAATGTLPAWADPDRIRAGEQADRRDRATDARLHGARRPRSRR